MFVTLPFKSLLHRNAIRYTFVRGILSTGYACDTKWKERFQQPLLSDKVVPDQLFTDITQRYIKKLKVGAIDIDLFANVITKDEQLDELEHVLLKLRKSRRTKDMLESTHHAVVKAYLNANAFERLMKVLWNRIDYGIFPDSACYNLLLDQFIEKGDFRNAVKVATLIMHQEDSSNPISNRLALYSTFKYACSPERPAWDEVLATENVEETNADDDEDEDDTQYIRVPRLRNAFHDDHFDLTEPMHLCGKALHFFGKQFEDVAGRSCQIIGLVLFEKWTKATEVLQSLSKKNSSGVILTRDTIDRVKLALESLTDEDEKKQAAVNFLQELEKLGSRLSDEKLEVLLTHKLAEVSGFEEADIQMLSLNYDQWAVAREESVRSQLDELQKDEKIKEIEAKRRELEEREKLLFFFENLNQHEVGYALAEQRTSSLRRQSEVDEEYIPPKIKH